MKLSLSGRRRHRGAAPMKVVSAGLGVGAAWTSRCQMMMRIVWATATAALGPDFLPIRRFSRRSRAPSRLWVWSVAQAASTRMVHRWALPWRVMPLVWRWRIRAGRRPTLADEGTGRPACDCQ
jgi:hypothetical protein